MASNAAQVAARIRGFGWTRDDLKNMLQAGALQIEGEAKQRAPYQTGSLKRDIGTEVRDEGSKLKAKIGNSTAIPYAPHQEFGTSRGVKPKAYLRGALRDKADEAVRDIAKAGKAILRAKA